MKILTSFLALIWFLGWGFWFLYARGHIQISSTESNIPDSVEHIQMEDTVEVVPEQEIVTSFLLNHPPRDSVEKIIDSLMTLRQSGEAIQVVSYYTVEEPYTGTNGNLGIQRSVNLLQNSSKRYSSQVLQPMGIKITEDIDTTGISRYFRVEKISKTSPIRILNDRRILVFFPYASDDEMASSKISVVLDSLTNIWSTENHHLIITGYTDNTAESTTNYDLGLKRAKSIQENIVANGFPEERITTLSRGEEDPIALNSTFDGRYLNRRVEILVDK